MTWGQWGFLTSEFDIAKMAKFTILTWSEFRPDKHKAFMVNSNYTKYELHLGIYVIYHKYT